MGARSMIVNVHGEYLNIDKKRGHIKFLFKKNHSGFGCKSEYRYLTKKECTDALKVNI